MLSLARSRLALAVQLAFLGVHSIATLLGTIYKYNTPQLYERNSHGPTGWVVTWIVVVQCVMELGKLALSIGHERSGSGENHHGLPPVTVEALERHHRAHKSEPYAGMHKDVGDYGDDNSSRSQSVSSTATYTQEDQRSRYTYDADELDVSDSHRSLLGNRRVDRTTENIFSSLPRRIVCAMNHLHCLINRIILFLGFVAFLTGAAVYSGVFVRDTFILQRYPLTPRQRGRDIFNGLAHIIKGGIFFWYGLLTLGRWMGCFVEYGWAWNMRPPKGVVSHLQSRVPSAEFVESFVIFLYGSTNVFLEHLAAWGKAWSPMDLEHLSITIMFFGGGLCGMLIESTRVRDLLNTVITSSLAAHKSLADREKVNPPKSYSFSVNPLPALVILLLGLMMSAHHQHSMVSTAIHKQWGTLFVGFALSRAVTYLLIYLKPPTSYLPSRPPSELVSAFCLISGGLIFMASNRNTVDALEAHGIHAMFPFTVVMGFTSFLMAWSIIVLAVKGWAIRRTSSAYLASFNAESCETG